MFCSTWSSQLPLSHSQASDLQICLSGCPLCISNNTGPVKPIQPFQTPLHFVFSASLGARTTERVPSQIPFPPSPSSLDLALSSHFIFQMPLDCSFLSLATTTTDTGPPCLSPDCCKGVLPVHLPLLFPSKCPSHCPRPFLGKCS